MYDALSDVAKDAAKLIPYLDSEWKPMTLTVMLDLPLETVRLAIYELADQGIIYRTNDIDEDDYGVLPLTKEFYLISGMSIRPSESKRRHGLMKCLSRTALRACCWIGQKNDG